MRSIKRLRLNLYTAGRPKTWNKKYTRGSLMNQINEVMRNRKIQNHQKWLFHLFLIVMGLQPLLRRIALLQLIFRDHQQKHHSTNLVKYPKTHSSSKTRSRKWTTNLQLLRWSDSFRRIIQIKLLVQGNWHRFWKNHQCFRILITIN